MFAGIGSMPAEVPPQMIEIEAVGAMASLWENRSMTPRSAASGQGPRSAASVREAWSHWRRRVLKRRMFPLIASALSKGGVDRVLHLRRGALDYVLLEVG